MTATTLPLTMLTWFGTRHHTADIQPCPELDMQGNSIIIAACDPDILALASWQHWGPPITGRPTHTNDCLACYPPAAKP